MENPLENSGSKTVTKNSAASSSKNPSQKVKIRSSSSSSSVSESSSSSKISSSDVSSSSSLTSSTSSSSEKNKRKKKALKRSSKRSKSSRKGKISKRKSKKISRKKKSDTSNSPNLYGQYNKVAGQPMGKKERKVLQATSTGFKPYPKTSELTKKSNLSGTFYLYKFHFCSLLFLYFQRKKLLAGKVKKGRFSVFPMP